MFKYLMIAALYPIYANADGYFKYGVGFHKDQNSFSEVKYLSAGVQQFHNVFVTQQEFGGYFDTKPGRSSAAHGSFSVGVRPTTDCFFAEGLWGAGFITATDQWLGGPFQFFQDLTLGLEDKQTSVGLSYRHISSAGLYEPNIGRDFILVKIGFRL